MNRSDCMFIPLPCCEKTVEFAVVYNLLRPARLYGYQSILQSSNRSLTSTPNPHIQRPNPLV
jgi:hypothetical protein